METLIINQQDKIHYNKNLQRVILNVVKETARLHKLPANTELSVLLVDNRYIQELNFLYRGINQATDVLSFAMNELGDEEPDFDFSGEVYVLGDIVISLERAQEQSEAYGHSLERELGFLMAHGMLHLLGYDHENDEEEKAMCLLQEKILKSLKLER